MLRHFFKDLFTEKDGETFDYIRIIGTFGILWWMSLQTFALLVQHAEFHPDGAAGGLSMLILGIGGGMAMRSTSRDTSTTDDNS